MVRPLWCEGVADASIMEKLKASWRGGDDEAEEPEEGEENSSEDERLRLRTMLLEMKF